MDEAFEKEVSPGSSGVTGVALLAIDSSGTPFIEKYYGRKGAVDPDKINENTLFWVYSITKTITAIATLQCVDRGLVNLDDSVYSTLPELKDFQIITPQRDGTFTLSPHTEKITVRHLLSHTSGIGVDLFDPRLQAWRLSRNEHPQTFSGSSVSAYTLPLLFEPGQGWAYGGGVEWAGILVERLTGSKLGDFMKENIFDPLGMASTTFHPDRREDLKERLASTSMRISDGSLVPMDGPYPLVSEDDSGAMGLVSSVADMAKLTAEMLKPSPSLLSKTSVAELFTPQFEPTSPAAEGLAMGAMMFGRLTGEGYDAHKVGQVPGAYYIKKDSRGLPGGTLVMTGIPNLVWFLNRERGIGGLYASAIMPPDDAVSSKLMTLFLEEAFRKS